MAGASVNVGTGTTLTAGTSGWTAELLSLDLNGIAREAIETSHSGTAAAGAGKHANRTYIPGDLADPGSLDVTFHFNPDTEPPIDQPAETWTVAFPLVSGDSTPASWAASGFMTEFSVTGPGQDDKMVGSATIKLSGNTTRTAAA